MKQFLLSISIFLLALTCHAQDLRVVKDNLNCTYGIKDKDGNWVVQAKYVLIEQYNSGYFSVRDLDGVGIFSPEGKELIPCLYDYITVSSQNWRVKTTYDSYLNSIQAESFVLFYGVRNKKKFIFNLKGIEIGSSSEMAELQIDSDHSIIAFDKTANSSFRIDSTGTVLIKKISGKLSLFKGNDYALVANYVQANGYANENVRLVNRKGEPIIKEVFDYAMIDPKGRLCYTLDEKFGAMTVSGETIIPPKYKRNDGTLSLDAKPAWVIFDEQDHAGIMKNDGTIIQKPIYDQIYPTIGYSQQIVSWMVKSGDRFGILDPDGKKVVPINYDQIYPIHRNTVNKGGITTNYIGRFKGKSYFLSGNDTVPPSLPYDSIHVISDYNYSYRLSINYGLVTKKNGKYGILNPDGTVLVNEIYDSYFRKSSGMNNYFFSIGKELIEYYFSRETISKLKWEPLISEGEIYVYRDPVKTYNYSAVLMSKKKDRIIGVNPEITYFNQYGNLLSVEKTPHKPGYLFNLNTKKKVPLRNLRGIVDNGRDQFVVSTNMNHHGIIDIDGNVIIDTIYNSISQSQKSSMIWASKIVNNRYVNILLDSIGRRVLPNEFDQAFELNSGDQMTGENQKKGVIDSKSLKWKIRPEHFCLLRLFGDYYYVGSAKNKKGIVYNDGSIILPTIYDTIILLYTNCQLNGNCPNDKAVEIRWLLRKGTTEFLADQDGKLITSTSAIRSFKSSLIFDDDSLFSGINYYPSFPVLDYSPSLHFLRGLNMKQIREKRKALWTNPLLKKAVFDTIHKRWLNELSNCPQSQTWYHPTVEGQDKWPLLEQQARKSCDCLTSSRFYSNRGSLVYQLGSIGTKFLTINLSYTQIYNEWDHMRSHVPPSPPNNQHINIIEHNGKPRFITLKEIFPNDDDLMEEFILSLGKRDDLALDCSSLETMLEMIAGNFSLSTQGVHIYLNQLNYPTNSQVELIIPVDNLSNHAKSKWIVPLLKN